MYLQKLEIQGFKSFAQKTELQFNRTLTAIVGPNGSGKSNIADAVRWVLGEQSIKLLRGKHAEDVIFAGSDKKSRAGLAEVSIYLNNEDGAAPVPYSEIVITRRVYRDGQSEYLMNNKAVRLADINLLLAQANFGQKTYSVIGQGMVDSILLSSPTERKEFFEEATGIKQYQLKREQAINKLLATFDNLEQVELVLQEITPRLRSLTRQVKRLEQREELERNLTELQKDYFTFRWHQLDQQKKQVDAEQKIIEQKLTTIRKDHQQLSQQMKGLEQGELLPQAYYQLQTKYDQERQKLNYLLKEQTISSAQEELQHIKKGEGEIAWLKQRQHELTVELNRENNSLDNTEKIQPELARRLTIKLEEEKKLVMQLQELSNQRNVSAEIQPKIAQLATNLDQWLNKLSAAGTLKEVVEFIKQGRQLYEELKTINDRLSGKKSSELQNILENKDNIIQEIATLKIKLEHNLNEQQQIKERVNKLTGEQKNITNALTGYVSTHNEKELAGQIAAVEKEVKELEQQLSNWHKTAEATKQEFFSLQNKLQTCNQNLRAVEQQEHELALELARLDTKAEDLEKEMSQEIPVELVQTIKKSSTIKDLDEGTTALEIQKCKHQLEATGSIEPEIIQEYQRTNERHNFLSTQQLDLKTAINSLEEIIHELDQTIAQEFTSNFLAINQKFGKYFQVLFNGGKAELKLQKEVINDQDGDETTEELKEAEEKPESQVAKEKFILQEKLKATMFSGVEIQATPPGKKLSAIAALSGGEKALASIALICSIISHSPSPFVVLDEVDAALDEANSDRYAAILDSLGNATQFITITHNRATMKRASILYGVTMGDDGISRLLSVKLDEASTIIGQPKKK